MKTVLEPQEETTGLLHFYKTERNVLAAHIFICSCEDSGPMWALCHSFLFFGCATWHARPGFEPEPPAVKVQSPNHWTAREVPLVNIMNWIVCQVAPMQTWFFNSKPKLCLFRKLKSLFATHSGPTNLREDAEEMSQMHVSKGGHGRLPNSCSYFIYFLKNHSFN